MIPPRRSIPVDHEVDPEPSDTGRDVPAFADDDAYRESYLGTGIVLILSVIAFALIGLIILGWRVPA